MALMKGTSPVMKPQGATGGVVGAIKSTPLLSLLVVGVGAYLLMRMAK